MYLFVDIIILISGRMSALGNSAGDLMITLSLKNMKIHS